VEFSELWPHQRAVDVEHYIHELGLRDRAGGERPFTVVNFVASIDGRASVHGHSGPLADDGDRAMFRALRREVDAVLVGTGTLAAERYGRILRDPGSRARRTQRGLRPEPLAVTVTRRGMLPLNIPLFAEPDAEVVVFTGADVDLRGVEAHVDVVRVPREELSFATALRHLRVEYDARALLCEGGPRVFSALTGEGAFHQLFLTVSPQVAGGGEAESITSGSELPEPATLALEGVLERHGTLFLRYAAGTTPAG
jgi:riboflavin biosynthesis pyrimidine reductase